MQKALPAVFLPLFLLTGCATPAEILQEQYAYYSPVCRELGYVKRADIKHCVDNKVEENNYFRATLADMATSGFGRVSTPIPPEPPKRSN